MPLNPYWVKIPAQSEVYVVLETTSPTPLRVSVFRSGRDDPVYVHNVSEIQSLYPIYHFSNANDHEVGWAYERFTDGVWKELYLVTQTETTDGDFTSLRVEYPEANLYIRTQAAASPRPPAGYVTGKGYATLQ